jgi:molecular chaperone GrpE
MAAPDAVFRRSVHKKIMRFCKLKKKDDTKTQEIDAAAGAASDGPETAAAPEEAVETAAGDQGETAEPPKAAEPDWKDQYARLMADFDNFKKRTARDREETYRYAEADILKDLLPTVDNLALALASAKDKEDDFVKGVRLVYDTFLSALKSHGAEPFDSLGLELDPERMEAIATLPSPDIEEGKVSTEVKRGWKLKDKLLRAAQVVASSGKPDNG